METNRTIIIGKGFLQGDNYSPVGFYLAEVADSMLFKETDGYTKGQREEERVKGTCCLFIDDLKIYEESHQKLKVENEMTVKASMDTGRHFPKHFFTTGKQ